MKIINIKILLNPHPKVVKFRNKIDIKPSQFRSAKY